jgi:diketogulonate reductase-like aldo/keto reductase
MLVWNIAKGRSVIPKSVTESRILSNYGIDGLELTEKDIAVIDAMEGRFKVCDGGFLPGNYKTEVFKGDDE